MRSSAARSPYWSGGMWLANPVATSVTSVPSGINEVSGMISGLDTDFSSSVEEPVERNRGVNGARGARLTLEFFKAFSIVYITNAIKVGITCTSDENRCAFERRRPTDELTIIVVNTSLTFVVILRRTSEIRLALHQGSVSLRMTWLCVANGGGRR